MPMNKAQLTKALELFERFVEAQEALAESAVMTVAPTIQSGAASEITPVAVTDSQPAPQVDGEDNPHDAFSLGAGGDEHEAQTELGDDSPVLDIKDKKAVEAFKTTLGNLLREFGGLTDPETAMGLIEEVTGSTKFSECPNDKLEELHDAVYDAIAEKEA